MLRKSDDLVITTSCFLISLNITLTIKNKYGKFDELEGVTAHRGA